MTTMMYLANICSHAICSLEQVTVCKEKGFICVSEAALPTHSIKRVIHFICALTVSKS